MITPAIFVRECQRLKDCRQITCSCVVEEKGNKVEKEKTYTEGLHMLDIDIWIQCNRREISASLSSSVV